MARVIAVTGTGTDAGKTVLAAVLARLAANTHGRVTAVKPVQTGVEDGESGDAAVVAGACPVVKAVTLRTFAPPCSPHLAAAMAGTDIDLGTMAAAIRCLADECEVLIVEGAGGLLVPLSREAMVADLFVELEAEVVVAVPNALGAVNHALLTFEAARARGLALAGFVLTQPAPPEETLLGSSIRRDNREILEAMGGVPFLGSLPYREELGDGPDPDAVWASLAEELRPGCAGLFANGQDRLTDGVHAQILAFDRDHVWHPYTSAVDPLPALEAVSTHGPSIRLRGTGPVLDGMSSWWAAIHGYNHPRLRDAAVRQMGRMPHVMFGGLTHEPAVALARRLLDLAPGMDRVFFSDSGSVAVEVAIKMAVQYQQAMGSTRKTGIMALRGGYHGDTLGAMSVCDPVNGMHSLFSGILPRQVFVDRPACRFDAPFDPETLRPLRDAFARHGETTAALILEPIVQGAGGMWFYHPHYLREAARLCREHGVLLIADEIATGFGRTGTLFACHWADVVPDILCLGKALTGGTMSLAATLASREVALGVSADGGVLMHGPTFMGNPLACAVGSASMDLLDEWPWPERVAAIRGWLQAGLDPCRNLPGVADVRVLGAIGVLEMEREVNVPRLQEYFVRRHRVWIRPFARLIYIMPPFIAARDHIQRLTSAMRGGVEERAWE